MSPLHIELNQMIVHTHPIEFQAGDQFASFNTAVRLSQQGLDIRLIDVTLSGQEIEMTPVVQEYRLSCQI